MKTANIQFYEGEANLVEVSITDADGDPVDLTTTSVDYKVLDAAGENFILEFTDGAEITITDAPGGVLTIRFSTTDTDQGVGKFPHEIRVSSPGYAETVLTGYLMILDSVFIGGFE